MSGPRGWLARLPRLLSLPHPNGLLVLVENAQDFRLRELVETLAPLDSGFDIFGSVTQLQEAPTGATRCLYLRPEEFNWLKLNRGIFRERRLRVVLWSRTETTQRLRDEAFDFFDMISHSLQCPEGPPPHGPRSLREAVMHEHRMIWLGGEFDASFVEAFPHTGYTRCSVRATFRDLRETINKSPGPWLLWDHVEIESQIELVLEAVESARRARELPAGTPEPPEPILVFEGDKVLPEGWPQAHALTVAYLPLLLLLQRYHIDRAGLSLAITGLEPQAVWNLLSVHPALREAAVPLLDERVLAWLLLRERVADPSPAAPASSPVPALPAVNPEEHSTGAAPPGLNNHTRGTPPPFPVMQSKAAPNFSPSQRPRSFPSAASPSGREPSPENTPRPRHTPDSLPLVPNRPRPSPTPQHQEIAQRVISPAIADASKAIERRDRAATMAFLGSFYRESGDPVLAEGLLQESSMQRTKVSSQSLEAVSRDQHLDKLSEKHQRMRWKAAQGDYSQAEKLARSSLKEQQEVFPEAPGEMRVSFYAHLIESKRLQGDYAGALSICDEAEQALRDVPQDHPAQARLRWERGLVLAHSGHPIDGLVLMQEALQSLRESWGEEDTTVCQYTKELERLQKVLGVSLAGVSGPIPMIQEEDDDTLDESPDLPALGATKNPDKKG
jgi:hypothetical protein